MSTHDLGTTLSVFWIIPFAGLLLCIAVLPLAAPKFWEPHRNKAIIAALCGLPPAIFIGLENWHEIWLVGLDYFSFITLLTALFIIAGGIHLQGDIEAEPQTNVFFLAVGAVLANLIGTTGASMLLIRGVLRTNRERQITGHIPIFFIFIVSNIGGLLLPIGDPPLFLGYLQGVPFFWTLKLFPIWVFTITLILLVFFVIDARAYARESVTARARDRAQIEPLRIAGAHNFLWLLGVLGAAIVLPTPFREIVMWAMAWLAWKTTRPAIRKQNEFTFNPIIEVAVLFAGIFAAMIPALLILKARGGELGITAPWQFFWATGGLSSFLDNAPTYLTFASLAQGVTSALSLPPDILLRDGGIAEMYLVAVSVGAVFMGANTYIGNAPNFMVKAISEEWRCKVPSFFGYMLWSGAILIPVFVLVTLIFFRT
jgi:Na+/H+ antiporter NhaD/arsenite permease-like protein